MTLQQLKYVVTIAEKGSMNLAAKELFLSQPSLSGAVEKLEEEIGISLFFRTNRGITLTPEGEDFLGYARQVLDQYQLLEDKYIGQSVSKKKFSVSMQHYTFAVKAFVDTVKEFGMDQFDFAIYETKTMEVIENVQSFKSELGILYLDDFNEKVIRKILQDKELRFTELFPCHVYVYMWKEHPLSGRDRIRLEDLEEYPCIAFDQGNDKSFFLSEEVLSTYDYKRIIHVDDRATSLNLMVGLNAYTLCSGVITKELNGEEYIAVPLEHDANMRIGYITRKNAALSAIAKKYIEALNKANTV